jgi:hypothetical protein
MSETDPSKMSNTEWERWAKARIAQLEAVAEAAEPCMNFGVNKGIQMVSNELKFRLGSALRAAGYLKGEASD